MISYTKLNLFTMSFLITFVIFTFLHFLFFDIQSTLNSLYNFQSNSNVENNIYTNTISNNTNVNTTDTQISNKSTINSSANKVNNNTEESVANNITEKENKTNNNVQKTVYNHDSNSWKLVIDKIGLEAEIREGTSTSVMDKYVGHFENTSILNGNIGLAAHNRGYPVNYFQNIKNLQKGDIIEYIVNGEVRKYSVETVAVIKDTDWTILQNTNDNRITLITCVENEPEYRRCVQGIQI